MSRGKTVTPRHQIDAFGGAAGEHDFVFGLRVNKFCDILAGGFECFGGAGAQAVNAALHGTVVLAVKVFHRVNDARGLLRGCRAVQEGEGLGAFIDLIGALYEPRKNASSGLIRYEKPGMPLQTPSPRRSLFFLEITLYTFRHHLSLLHLLNR